MTKVFGAITGWMMVIHFVKRRIRSGKENQAWFEHTEFEILVLHPSEQKKMFVNIY